MWPSTHTQKHFNISKLAHQQLEHAQQTHQEVLQTQDFLTCHRLVMNKVGGMSQKCIQQRAAAFSVASNFPGKSTLAITLTIDGSHAK